MTANINTADVFAPSNTGTKAHAFLGSRGAKDGNVRAACRVTIQRSVSATFISLDRARKFYSVCDACVKLYQAAEDRAEASMQPATEAQDLGYVAPVDERTEQPAAERYGLAVGGLTFYAKQTEATPIAAPLVDLSTEDGTLKMANGDELTRRGHWADVWLADGRTYSVSMKVHRKGTEGASTILVDHVIYWTETAGRSTGPIRIACPEDKPRSVGGRIWRLLLAANIA